MFIINKIHEFISTFLIIIIFFFLSTDTSINWSHSKIIFNTTNMKQ